MAIRFPILIDDLEISLTDQRYTIKLSSGATLTGDAESEIARFIMHTLNSMPGTDKKSHLFDCLCSQPNRNDYWIRIDRHGVTTLTRRDGIGKRTEPCSPRVAAVFLEQCSGMTVGNAIGRNY